MTTVSERNHIHTFMINTIFNIKRMKQKSVSLSPDAEPMSVVPSAPSPARLNILFAWTCLMQPHKVYKGRCSQCSPTNDLSDRRSSRSEAVGLGGEQPHDHPFSKTYPCKKQYKGEGKGLPGKEYLEGVFGQEKKHCRSKTHTVANAGKHVL